MKRPKLFTVLLKDRPKERLALDLRVAHLTPAQRTLLASLRRLPTKEKD